MPICKLCKEDKLPEEFTLHKKTLNGLQTYCRECVKEKYYKARTHGQRQFQRYGISEPEYLRMYQEQSGCCAICLKPFDLLCVDHNHTTEQIRGLLCHRCNIIVGCLEDSNCAAAKLYLDKERPDNFVQRLIRMGSFKC